MQIEPIAHIHTDFPTKFGVPRQSGLASELTSTIVFAPPTAIRTACAALRIFRTCG